MCICTVLANILMYTAGGGLQAELVEVRGAAPPMETKHLYFLFGWSG